MKTDLNLSLQTGLRQHRRKLTRPRRIVLDVLTQASHHLTPAQVHHRARARDPRLGLATVYRTLDLLVELGYAQRVHQEAGCHSYLASARPHGHYLVCTVCGRALEFDGCDLASLMADLEAKTGYEIQVHMLELMGRCPACRTPAA